MQTIGKKRRNRIMPNLIVFALVISFMLLLPMRCLAQASDSSAEASGVAADQQGGSGQSPAANSDSAEKADTSGGGEPVKLEWNTKFAYSPIFRVAKQSQELINTAYDPEAMNLDDGDRNFHRGLVSNRVDVFSELDVTFGQRLGNTGEHGSLVRFYIQPADCQQQTAFDLQRSQQRLSALPRGHKGFSISERVSAGRFCVRERAPRRNHAQLARRTVCARVGRNALLRGQRARRGDGAGGFDQAVVGPERRVQRNSPPGAAVFARVATDPAGQRQWLTISSCGKQVGFRP